MGMQLPGLVPMGGWEAAKGGWQPSPGPSVAWDPCALSVHPRPPRARHWMGLSKGWLAESPGRFLGKEKSLGIPGTGPEPSQHWMCLHG